MDRLGRCTCMLLSSTLKLFISMWKLNFVPALQWMTPTQCKEGHPLQNWSQFVINIQSQTSTTQCYSYMSHSLTLQLHFTFVSIVSGGYYVHAYIHHSQGVMHRKAICQHFTLHKLPTCAYLLRAWKVVSQRNLSCYTTQFHSKHASNRMVTQVRVKKKKKQL